MSTGMQYALKQIDFQDKKLSIVTQNTNGPCPLLALCNVLILRGGISLPMDKDRVSSNELVQMLAELLTNSPACNAEAAGASLGQVLDILPTLEGGLDIDVDFTRSRIDRTQGTSVFDVFGVHLYHGWICGPDDAHFSLVSRISTYNKLMECILAGQVSTDNAEKTSDQQIVEGLAASQFLQDTSSQLTYVGMYALALELPVNDPQVFFRNNHFSTILKTEDNRLWTLVTDEGYCNEREIVWESLDVQGDSEYVDFRFSPISTGQKSVEEGSDFEFARMLQAQEDELAAAQVSSDLNERLQGNIPSNYRDEQPLSNSSSKPGTAHSANPHSTNQIPSVSSPAASHQSRKESKCCIQ